MDSSIKYSCLVDGYTARDLFSGSTRQSMINDMLSMVYLHEKTITQKPLLTIESSALIIRELDTIFYFCLAFFAQFESFTEQDSIKSRFRDLNIKDKINELKDRLEHL